MQRYAERERKQWCRLNVDVVYIQRNRRCYFAKETWMSLVLTMMTYHEREGFVRAYVEASLQLREVMYFGRLCFDVKVCSYIGLDLTVETYSLDVNARPYSMVAAET